MGETLLSGSRSLKTATIIAYATAMHYMILCLSLVSTIVSAGIYRQVDEKGNVHYSDTPISGQAEKYTPPPILVVPAGPDDFNFKDRSVTSYEYKSIRITTPDHDTVYTPDKTAVPVSISVSPALNTAQSHRLVFYLNGQLHGEGKTSYTLNDLPRGSYTVSASVLDKKGKRLISSDSITFHVQRHHL